MPALTTVGFIGSGQMATALARGWLDAGLIKAKGSASSDPVPASRIAFTAMTGLKTFESNIDAIGHADLVVLAVKPQTIDTVLRELKQHLTEKQLIMSIAAGVTLKTLAAGLGDVPLVRVMPNTPCLIGASASAFALGRLAMPGHRDLVLKLLSAVGLAIEVPEKQLDAVTGLSGSGPAYVLLVIEALADGGVKMGLSRDVALKLAAQTVFGTARMALQATQHPAVLREAVTSPGGTSISGLHELEKACVRAAFMSAVESATKRATELGQT